MPGRGAPEMITLAPPLSPSHSGEKSLISHKICAPGGRCGTAGGARWGRFARARARAPTRAPTPPPPRGRRAVLRVGEFNFTPGERHGRSPRRRFRRRGGGVISGKFQPRNGSWADPRASRRRGRLGERGERSFPLPSSSSLSSSSPSSSSSSAPSSSSSASHETGRGFAAARLSKECLRTCERDAGGATATDSVPARGARIRARSCRVPVAPVGPAPRPRRRTRRDRETAATQPRAPRALAWCARHPRSSRGR